MSTEDYQESTNTVACLRCGNCVDASLTTKHDVWHAALAATPLIEQNQELTSRAGTLEEQLEETKRDLAYITARYKSCEDSLITRNTELQAERIASDKLLHEYQELYVRFDQLAKSVETQVANIRRNTMDPTKRFWHFLDELEKTLTAVRRPF